MTVFGTMCDTCGTVAYDEPGLCHCGILEMKEVESSPGTKGLVKKLSRRAGWSVVRQKGSHVIKTYQWTLSIPQLKLGVFFED